MSSIRTNADITIDIDGIVTEVVNSSDFDSAVENAIDNYDFSYTFQNHVEDVINDANLIDKYDVEDHILKAVQDSTEVRNEIYLITSGTTSQPTALDFTAIAECLALCHKTIGQLSQQIAVINAMCGASVWPNSTTEHLHNLYGKIEKLGYTFDNDSTVA